MEAPGVELCGIPFTERGFARVSQSSLPPCSAGKRPFPPCVARDWHQTAPPNLPGTHAYRCGPLQAACGALPGALGQGFRAPRRRRCQRGATPFGHRAHGCHKGARAVKEDPPPAPALRAKYSLAHSLVAYAESRKRLVGADTLARAQLGRRTFDGRVETRPLIVIQVVTRVGGYQFDLAAFGQVDGLVENQTTPANGSLERQDQIETLNRYESELSSVGTRSARAIATPGVARPPQASEPSWLPRVAGAADIFVPGQVFYVPEAVQGGPPPCNCLMAREHVLLVTDPPRHERALGHLHGIESPDDRHERPQEEVAMNDTSGQSRRDVRPEHDFAGSEDRSTLPISSRRAPREARARAHARSISNRIDSTSM